jgi:hypothetical protein
MTAPATTAGTFEDEPEGVFPDSELMFDPGLLLDGIEGLLPS